MRFVLRRIEPGAPSGTRALAVVRRCAVVLDAAPGMLLIRATRGAASRIAAELPGWVLARETLAVPAGLAHS